MKLLINEQGKKKIYKDLLKTDINVNEGLIKKIDFNSDKEIIKTNVNKKFIKINPNFTDLFFNIKRQAQIITLKDAYFIAGELGLKKGFKVLDSGAGSGASASVFANIVGKTGKVVLVEKEKRFADNAQKNLQSFGFKNFKIITKNIESFKTKTIFDAVNLDMATPWKAIQTVNACLKNGGMLTIYVPNTTQAIKMFEETKNSVFKFENMCELIKRNWELKDKICRPKFKMLGHTGFILTFRKLDFKE